ncbi:MAG: YaiI/YqxD family protein [Candidatus Dependentiae bacterium]|nr:YaiI/YqxD family protein [Candidatus Dependentiae bacterium]
MLIIYIDGDACPVKEDIFRIAKRHGLQVYLVSNSRLNMDVDENVHKIQVDSGPDAADNWIVEHITIGDIVITVDILLADRCLKNGARAISPTGKVFNSSNIGSAKAMRDLRAYLRETGIAPSYNAAFSKNKRSQFLQALEETIQSIKRTS